MTCPCCDGTGRVKPRIQSFGGKLFVLPDLSADEPCSLCGGTGALEVPGPGKPTAERLYKAGNQAYEDRRFSVAAECYRAATAADPEFSHAFHNLGDALDELGKRTEALEAWEKSLELCPTDAFSWRNAGHALAEDGDLEGATTHLLRAVCLNPYYLNALSDLALVCQRRGWEGSAFATCTWARRVASSVGDRHPALPRILQLLQALGPGAGGIPAWHEAPELAELGILLKLPRDRPPYLALEEILASKDIAAARNVVRKDGLACREELLQMIERLDVQDDVSIRLEVFNMATFIGTAFLLEFGDDHFRLHVKDLQERHFRRRS